jgi:hypothetical protein
LASIAERGHVYSRRDGRSYEEFDGVLQLVGTKKASTFPGFCNLHDTNSFIEADNSPSITKDISFLVSYRSLCYEVQMKQAAREALEIAKNYADRGAHFEEQARNQNDLNREIHLMDVGYREHLRRKVLWDRHIKNNNIDSFSFQVIDIPKKFPMLGSGTFFPEYDFQGRYLQPPGKSVHMFDLLAFNFCSFGSKLAIIFGWMEGEKESERFVESLKEVPAELKSEAIMRFCLDITDNLFVRPSWWDEKTTAEKSELSAFSMASLPGKRTKDALVPTGGPLFRE